jgi:hypothetical protein
MYVIALLRNDMPADLLVGSCNSRAAIDFKLRQGSLRHGCFGHSTVLPASGLSVPALVGQGSGIEPVITYLRKWLRIERTHIGRLLWSYPLDYSLPRLVMPSQAPVLAATIDETVEDAAADDDDSSSSSSAATASAAGAPDEQAQPDKQQSDSKPKRLPPIGSAERCTWLVMPPDSDAEEGGASSGSGSSSSQ